MIINCILQRTSLFITTIKKQLAFTPEYHTILFQKITSIYNSHSKLFMDINIWTLVGFH